MPKEEGKERWTGDRILIAVSIAVILLIGIGAFTASALWQAHQPQRYANLLRSSYRRWQAVSYFIGRGSDAFPQLERLLDSDNENQRVGAVYILRKMGWLDVVPEDKLIEFYIYLARCQNAFERGQEREELRREGWAWLHSMGPKVYPALIQDARRQGNQNVGIAVLTEHATRDALDALAGLLNCNARTPVSIAGVQLQVRDSAAWQIVGLTGRCDLYRRSKTRNELDAQIRDLKDWWAQNRARPIDDIQREAVDRFVKNEQAGSRDWRVLSRIVARNLRRRTDFDQLAKTWPTIRDKPREVWVISGFREAGIDVSRPWDEDDVDRLIEQLSRSGSKRLGLSADWLLRHIFGDGPRLVGPRHVAFEEFLFAERFGGLMQGAQEKWQDFVYGPDCPDPDEGTQPKPARRF